MADTQFYEQIKQFNELYKLQSNETPTVLKPQRIKDFKDILAEEVDEADDIVAKYEKMLSNGAGELSQADRRELLTDMADWLGDIVVYCASEARRWGLPLDRILNVIMESNFSKLDANGKPIYDERGKVMKGPNYWKPEPKILEMLSKDEPAL